MGWHDSGINNKYDCLGCHQARIEKGKTEQELNTLLVSVPDEMRTQVVAHVKTCKQLANKAEMVAMRQEDVVNYI